MTVDYVGISVRVSGQQGNGTTDFIQLDNSNRPSNDRLAATDFTNRPGDAFGEPIIWSDTATGTQGYMWCTPAHATAKGYVPAPGIKSPKNSDAAVIGNVLPLEQWVAWAEGVRELHPDHTTTRAVKSLMSVLDTPALRAVQDAMVAPDELEGRILARAQVEELVRLADALRAVRDALPTRSRNNPEVFADVLEAMMIGITRGDLGN
jgi:hypothetical protein